MEEEKGYNGWANYETWVVNLWICNEEGPYNFWRTEAKEKIEDDEESAGINLSEELKNHYEELNPIKTASVWNNLMQAALGKVDWYEIAESIINEAKEDE